MKRPNNKFLADLAARQQIRDVLVRYCRGADRCDAGLMQSCFHQDAWDEHGFFSGSAWEFAGNAASSLAGRFVSTSHFMTNEYVELHGSIALSETCVLAFMRLEREGELFDITFRARYLDRFECREDGWKIGHRQLVSDGNRIDRVTEQDPRLGQAIGGGRTDRDPSYAFFSSVAPA